MSGRAARLGRVNGFDGLRLLLALGIVMIHSFTITGNLTAMPAPLQAAGKLILPGFFALSGYLVASSLARCNGVREFLALRLVRILPSLAVVVAVTALVLGPLMTRLPLADYIRDPALPAYFQNVLGLPQFFLPGLFEFHPRGGVVNGSLWSIQLELACYLMLATLALLFRRYLVAALAALGLLLLFPRTPFAGELLVWLPAKELPLAFCAGALLFHFARLVPLHPAAGLFSLAAVYAATLTWGFMPALSLPLAYGLLWLGMRKIPAALARADYSYGVYLCAYPLQQAYVQLFPGHVWWAGNLLFALPLALLCAAALWHGLEKPLLARKHEIVARLAPRRRMARI